MDNKLIKGRIKQQFISEYSGLFSKDKVNEEEIKNAINYVIENISRREQIILPEEEKSKIIEELLDEFIGYGPIQGILKDPQITEIMINGPKKVYIERMNKTELSNITFENEQQLMHTIYKMLAPTRRRVDESFPFTEIALRDGSRVNIIIPPLALDGPTVTIRKFLKEIRKAEDLINLGTMDKRMSDFLVACIKAKMNIIFSGATGAGKTTTLNVLSSYIPNNERIVTIEDTSELHLAQDHVVRLETRPPSIEGKGDITLRDLFKNSLRMRPDRIILGEIRGAEVLEMIQAICSGHGGALSVIHANTPEDVLYRIEGMILTSGVALNMDAIHRQIAAAINLIVQQEQLLDGSRKVTHISQINGLQDGRVVLEDIFVYDIESIDADGKVLGRWKATGVLPAFYPKFKKAGVDLPREIFNKD